MFQLIKRKEEEVKPVKETEQSTSWIYRPAQGKIHSFIHFFAAHNSFRLLTHLYIHFFFLQYELRSNAGSIMSVSMVKSSLKCI